MPITENILPHLNYFWHVAQQMSFTRAAKNLRISQSAVSLQIQALESKLQMQLFQRKSKNNLSLTTAGQKLFDHCRTIFSEVDNTLTDLLSKQFVGPFGISTATTFGILVLIPFLKSFEGKNPQLATHLDVTDSLVDFSKGNTDVAVRWGPSRDARLTYDVLANEHYAIVASSAYLKNNKPIKTPKDLDEHTVIVRTSNMPDWKAWLDTLPKKIQPSLSNTRVISNTFAMIEAVKLGMGISLFSMYPIKELLAKSKLERLLVNYPCPPLPFYLCYPKSNYPRPKISAFKSSLQSYLKTYGSKVFEIPDIKV